MPLVERYCAVCKTIRGACAYVCQEEPPNCTLSLGGSLWAESLMAAAQGFSGPPWGDLKELSACEYLSDEVIFLHVLV